MQLPSFSDFLSSINQDALEKEVSLSTGIRMAYIENLMDAGNLDALIAWLIDQAVNTSTKISLLYLQAYHQWLQEQLERSDDHPIE